MRLLLIFSAIFGVVVMASAAPVYDVRYYCSLPIIQSAHMRHFLFHPIYVSGGGGVFD